MPTGLHSTAGTHSGARADRAVVRMAGVVVAGELKSGEAAPYLGADEHLWQPLNDAFVGQPSALVVILPILKTHQFWLSSRRLLRGIFNRARRIHVFLGLPFPSRSGAFS